MLDETPDSDTILLVDSDTMARTLIADYLRSCGYRVLEAADLSEAMLALEAHQVDLVVSEVELNGSRGGFDLAAWVRANRMGIEVILTSSIERSADAAAELCEQGPIMNKPYQARQLADEIRRLRGR